ncbi:MAG: hypothetical protein KGL39_49605 [Patescibacteria group bacterium]|nr:hypothetical protein [Patescibacteria group bacterium]
MNPVAHNVTSMTFGMAFTVILNEWLKRFGWPPLGPEESNAYLIVLSGLFGYYIHLRTINPNYRMFFRRRLAPPAVH